MVGLDSKTVLCSAHCKKMNIFVDWNVRKKLRKLYCAFSLFWISKNSHIQYTENIVTVFSKRCKIVMYLRYGGRMEQSSVLFTVLHPRQRGFYRIRALLARQRFFTVPYRTVHFLSSIYTGCISCWSSFRGLNLLSYRDAWAYVSGPPILWMWWLSLKIWWLSLGRRRASWLCGGFSQGCSGFALGCGGFASGCSGFQNVVALPEDLVALLQDVVAFRMWWLCLRTWWLCWWA